MYANQPMHGSHGAQRCVISSQSFRYHTRRAMIALHDAVAVRAAKRAAMEDLRAELQAGSLRRQLLSWQETMVALREVQQSCQVTLLPELTCGRRVL